MTPARIAAEAVAASLRRSPNLVDVAVEPASEALAATGLDCWLLADLPVIDHRIVVPVYEGADEAQVAAMACRDADGALRQAADLDRELAAAVEWLLDQPEVIAAEVAPATGEERADCGPCRRLTARLDGGEVASTLIWPGLSSGEAIRHLLAVHRREVRALAEMGPARN